MQASIAFTFVTVICTSITLVITLTLIVIIGSSLRRDRDVSLLLIFNTYVTIAILSLVLVTTRINVLRADFDDAPVLNDLDTTACRFHGFMLYETFCCCYMSFVLQALYRLIRVIYAKYKFLQVRVLPDSRACVSRTLKF